MKICIISARFQPPYFEGNVTYIKTIKFRSLKVSTCHLRKFGADPQSFKGYYQIKNLCEKNNPPTEIIDYEINLNIYKIDNSFKEQFVEENYDPEYKITEETENLWH